MPVSVPFRITPSLGPGLRVSRATNHWDTISPNTGAQTPSYQLGTVVVGNDGRDYIYARATPAFAANARMDIADGTFLATANASGAWMAPVAVAAGDAFHARRFAQ
jgi:hypothetical protein